MLKGGEWKEYIVMRSHDQIWSWDDGVKAGCVRAGLNFSGAVFENWGWGRRQFEDALAEAGWYGPPPKKGAEDDFLKEVRSGEEERSDGAA